MAPKTVRKVFMNQRGFSSWFKGIKGRLLIVALCPFVAFAVLFYFTYSGLNTISKLVESAHENIIPNISALDDMRIAQNRFGYRMWESLVNADDRAEGAKECAESLKYFEAGYAKYSSNPFDPEEEKLYASVKDDFPRFIKMSHEILDGLVKNTPESLKVAQSTLDENLHPLSTKLEEFNEAVTAYYDKRAGREKVEFKESRTQIINLAILVTVCAGFSILGLLLLTAAKISGSVGKIAEDLSSSGARVVDAVEQLSEAGNALSHNSTEAAASLEETVAALEEMSSMVQMNSDNAKQAAALSVSSREAAEKGESEIRTLIKSMGEISQSSKKIEEIISVIDDIAFQTNLLALNAAVEAARAGEQGKGFAVVAEAVRALAQRSASSAKDISGLIKDSVDQVQRGGKIADQSGEMLANIVNSIKKVSDLNNEIAAASGEQTTGIQQISKAMNQLDQSAQSNAASAEEIAATSSEINELAQTSQNLTVELNSVVLGAGDYTHSSAQEHSPEKSASGAKASAAAHKPAKAVMTSSGAKFKAGKPSSPKPTQAKVIPLKRPEAKAKANEPTTAQETIPFDDDPRAKVGTTDGF